VELLKLADDKCQKLFENCFRMIEGPHAPDLTAVELDQRLIVHISNPLGSNNYLESYGEVDPFISTSYSVDQRTFKFQGYQVFQLKNKDVTINQIYDQEVSKLVFQCDIEDDVTQLVNFYWDAAANANSYQVMVNGANKGIQHTFEILYDMFAPSGQSKLVNYKKYYYVAIAYAYNNYKQYNQNDPSSLDGQKTPYLGSRKATTGEIKKYEFIPRPVEVRGGGTVLNSEYGDKPAMTYSSGRGNGTNWLELEQSTIDSIMAGEPWVASSRKYKKNYGPFNVKVVDPLNVKPGNYALYLEPDVVKTASHGGIFSVDYILVAGNPKNRDNNGLILNTKWTLVKDGTDTTRGPLWFRNPYEYIIPEYGIAIDIMQTRFPVDNVSALTGLPSVNNGILGATIEYSNPLNRWYNGLQDQEGQTPFNWIRAGSFNASGYADIPGDPDQYFEKILGGTWSAYRFVSNNKYHPGNSKVPPATIDSRYRMPSVDIVITKDKSKWTRCIVIETCEDADITTSNNPVAEGGARKFMLRQAPSKNKEGVSADSMSMAPSNNPDDPNFISAYGMSWFPGYAIDVETGQRLNMAFGEDSYLVGENGRDMLWNPTSAVLSIDGTPVLGGKHFIYVFGTGLAHSTINGGIFPSYDYGRVLFQMFRKSGTENVNTQLQRIGRTMLNVAYVSIPLIPRAYRWNTYDQMPNNEVKVKIRLAYPYHANLQGTIFSDSLQLAINKGYPYVTFSLDDLAPTRNDVDVAKTALDRVNVVPNPYYAHNPYELTQLDNLVKIINLPRECTVRIYNMAGTLIREFTKSSDQSWIDWNLTNSSDVPVAGGIYLIHISAPNVGERVIKWFGVMRPADLSNF
ncbi:MAG TPA: T9SS type A sorting domain-containing protein, partial [Salinivirgaceae bacterium]|nr:T9SS type A sorting domain-containing protein [Salinivirgaceae bacterium]